MRLTNNLRDAFIRAAMADVPQIDYDEKINTLALKTALEVMPLVVRTAYEKHPTFFIAHLKYIGANDAYWKRVAVFVPMIKEFSAEANRAAEPLIEANHAQRKALTALEQKLRAAAYSVNTAKALINLLPEFGKYLPASEAKTTNLPAVANLVSDFVKAGWPKGQVAA